jgi:hypothetical protein
MYRSRQPFALSDQHGRIGCLAVLVLLALALRAEVDGKGEDIDDLNTELQS